MSLLTNSLSGYWQRFCLLLVDHSCLWLSANCVLDMSLVTDVQLTCPVVGSWINCWNLLYCQMSNTSGRLDLSMYVCGPWLLTRLQCVPLAQSVCRTALNAMLHWPVLTVVGDWSTHPSRAAVHGYREHNCSNGETWSQQTGEHWLTGE